MVTNTRSSCAEDAVFVTISGGAFLPYPDN